MTKIFINNGQLSMTWDNGNADGEFEIWEDNELKDIRDPQVFKKLRDILDNYTKEIDRNLQQFRDWLGFSLIDRDLLGIGDDDIKELMNWLTQYRNKKLLENPTKPDGTSYELEAEVVKKVPRPSEALNDKQRANIIKLVDEYIDTVVTPGTPSDTRAHIPAVRDGLFQFAAWLLKK